MGVQSANICIAISDKHGGGVQSSNICIAISNKHGGPECKHLYSYFKQTWGSRVHTFVKLFQTNMGVKSANICIAISDKHGGSRVQTFV